MHYSFINTVFKIVLIARHHCAWTHAIQSRFNDTHLLKCCILLDKIKFVRVKLLYRIFQLKVNSAKLNGSTYHPIPDFCRAQPFRVTDTEIMLTFHRIPSHSVRIRTTLMLFRCYVTTLSINRVFIAISFTDERTWKVLWIHFSWVIFGRSYTCYEKGLMEIAHSSETNKWNITANTLN